MGRENEQQTSAYRRAETDHSVVSVGGQHRGEDGECGSTTTQVQVRVTTTTSGTTTTITSAPLVITSTSTVAPTVESVVGVQAMSVKASQQQVQVLPATGQHMVIPLLSLGVMITAIGVGMIRLTKWSK